MESREHRYPLVGKGQGTRHQLAGKHQLFTRSLEIGWADGCPSKVSLSESNMNAAICLEAEGNGHGL